MHVERVAVPTIWQPAVACTSEAGLPIRRLTLAGRRDADLGPTICREASQYVSEAANAR